jgi:hypothetical protein
MYRIHLETTVGHWEVVPAVLGCYGSLADGVEAVCRFLDGEADEKAVQDALDRGYREKGEQYWGPGSVCQPEHCWAGGRSIGLRPFAGGIVSLSLSSDGVILVDVAFGRDSLYQHAKVAAALSAVTGLTWPGCDPQDWTGGRDSKFLEYVDRMIGAEENANRTVGDVVSEARKALAEDYRRAYESAGGECVEE